MNHLEINQQMEIKVEANLHFGGDIILDVFKDEQYSFQVGQEERWTDWFKKTDADGFWNPLLLISKPRLRGVKCFALCGTIGQDETNHFAIGSSLRNHTISVSGQLYFFPNDSFKHYDNNKGMIIVQLKRVK